MRDVSAIPDAYSFQGQIRFVFSELLDPSVETIVDGVGTLATTQPVTVTCAGTEVAYDGYYDPSGNNQTLPPGPSLVIEPEFMGTATDCTVALKETVTDKSDNPVVADLRGPYTFTTAVMTVVETLPADEDKMVDPGATLLVLFNAPVSPDTLAGNITLTGAADVPVTLSVSEDDPRTVMVKPTGGPLMDETEYTLTISGGITDIGGGAFDPEEPVTVVFTTGTYVAPDGGTDDAGTDDAGTDDAGADDAGTDDAGTDDADI